MILHNLMSSEGGTEVPTYLFETSSNDIAFCMIETEMRDLNELCYRLDEAAIDQLKRASSVEVVDPVTGELDSGWTDFMRNDGVLRWNSIQEIVVAGMILALLFTLTEKWMKMLCDMTHPSPSTGFRGKSQGPKIEAYLKFLREECLLDFENSPQFDTALSIARPFRNRFVHGDWEEFDECKGAVDLSFAFAAVSSQFKEIEIAYMIRRNA